MKLPETIKEDRWKTTHTAQSNNVRDSEPPTSYELHRVKVSSPALYMEFDIDEA